MRKFTIILLFIFSINVAYNQDIAANKSNKASWLIDTIHSPKKAAYMALIPGLGQAYNRKYWKIPIVYGALATTTYFIVDYNKQYQKFRTAYTLRMDTISANDTEPLYLTESLLAEKNKYWKKRDLMVIVTAGVYLLNIIDAVVDAHLYTFDLNDNLAMQIKPHFGRYGSSAQSYEYGLTMRFKF